LEERAKLPAPLLIGLLVAIIVICAVFAVKGSMPAKDNRVFPDNPEVVWLKQKSKDTGGDWSKFSPEEQDRANKATAGRGAMSVAIYAKGAGSSGGGH
jgi:hypothetical protein